MPMEVSKNMVKLTKMKVNLLKAWEEKISLEFCHFICLKSIGKSLVEELLLFSVFFALWT
jgi:hypothetical protein